MTKNITLSVDEATLDEVRVYAAKHKTTVNGLVRDFLEEIATRDSRYREMIRRLDELSEKSTAEIGPITWTRDELYDR